MYNFHVWRSWLEGKAAELRATGLRVTFTANVDSEPVKMGLGNEGTRALALFENWERGHADGTVEALVSSEWKMVWHNWMQMASDETFESMFEEFVAQFRRYEFTNE